MIKLAIKIYLLANLSVILSFLFLILLAGEELSLFLFVAMVSLIISLPVIPALFLVFWIVAIIRQSIFIKWMMLLFFIVVCSAIPALLVQISYMPSFGVLLQFSMPAALLGVLFQANPINQYLINSYGKEYPETI